MVKLNSENAASLPSGKEALYVGSFPPEERREWQDILTKTDSEPGFSFLTVVYDGRPAGFITTWDLGKALYIEHFAIDPSQRGKGIGMAAIKSLIMKSPLPIVLEAEPESTGEMARRRIAFYSKAGFTAHHSFPYVQPPYFAGLPSVPLTLLTTKQLPLDEISTTLHREVYGVKG